MSSQGFIFVVIAALLMVSSNLMLRAGITRAGGFAICLSTVLNDLKDLAQQPLVVAGVFFYALAALVWFRVISTENLNTSYPVLVGLTFTIVTIGATVFFREPINALKVLGLGLIFTERLIRRGGGYAA